MKATAQARERVGARLPELAPLLATAPRDRDGHPILPGARVRVEAPNPYVPSHPVRFVGDVESTPTLIRHGVPAVCVVVTPRRRGSAIHPRTVAPETCTVLREGAAMSAPTIDPRLKDFSEKLAQFQSDCEAAGRARGWSEAADELNRLASALGDKDLAELAKAWLRKAVLMLPNKGLASTSGKPS